MKRFLRDILFLGFTLWGCIIIAQEVEQDQRTVKSDSLMDTYSIDEILDYREFYQNQILHLEKKKKALRQKGIKEAEDFFKSNPNSRILDKVIMRLAELYYQEANEKFLEEMQQYDQMVDKLEKKGIDSVLVEPQKNYDKSLALYQRIIEEFPHSNLLDDAIYNKAFLLEELGNNKESIAIYQQVITEFPSSRYVPEALMRIAEYYFNPPINNIETAIEYYKQLLKFKDSPKYDEALYRLGWCYYRLNNYPEAVAHFTLLADDVERARKLDPSQRYTNPALRDESIEYIGISFLDYGGPRRAAEYIKSIGGRKYGLDILKKIGDVYKDEKEEYKNAIDTYNLLLKMYPDDREAPEIQANIVECYRHMKDDMMAYLSRDKLYNQYKAGSPWWQKNNDEEIREKTNVVTERALRDNINLLYQKAATTDDLDLLLQAVNDSKKYLKSFPDDTSAPRIHWNMALVLDTKLKDYNQAYDEYMKICDLYWNSKYQKDAAKNAIALAKDAVASDTTKKKIQAPQKTISELQESSSVLSAITYNRIELTEKEKKLARAYDNYIKLFPHEPETATILANAGALYYNNNQFSEALRYFNTIVRHFPNSKDINYAQYTIMESYFGKRDFRSAEIVARKLKNTVGADSSLVEKSKKRLAESIFLAAEVLADSANHLAAGNEYIRMVLEVPDAEFADLSLFQAALEYDKAKEYSRAVETYNYLIDTKPNSKYLLDAMNNSAIDYGELGEYKNAAITYEKLAYTATDSLKAYDALYNASIFFVKAEEWEDAIRINRSFVKKYPESKDADDLFFDIATYYLKLDDLDNANKIYGEYVQAYPNSPRVVETYFHRGEYYRNKNEVDRAIIEYNKAVTKNEEFKKKNIESNDFFAAEAIFSITKLKYDEFRRIEFVLPRTKMEQDKKKKRALLKEVIDGFTRTVSYGTLRLYEATYLIGDSYEEFAQTWARQEIPPMETTKKIIVKKEINHTSAELYERAVKSYKQAVNVLIRLAKKYEQELLATADTTNLIDESRLKIVREDSTLRVANKWIERCKEKVSEVIYDIAELNFASVNSFLEAPIPPGLDYVAEMEYRKQVLNKAVAPLIKEITDAHTRNIKEAWEMGLENQWVKLSRNKIVATNNILSDEYNKLAVKALTLYENSSQSYMNIIEKGGVTPEGFDAITISDQMANLIDFGKTFATVAMELKKKILKKAIDENISDPVVAKTKEKILKDLFEYTQMIDSLLATTNFNRKNYENLYKETDNPEYEEALYTYEDNYFSFKESMTELLEAGFEISEEMNIKNQWTSNILLSLVLLKPEQYSSLLNLTIVNKNIVTDDTWMVSTDYYPGWSKIDYDDSFWSSAQIIEEDTFAQAEKPAKIWYMTKDTLAVVPDSSMIIKKISQFDSTITDTSGGYSIVDTTGTLSKYQTLISSKPQIRSVPSNHLFFRKTFFIEGLPVSAEIKLKVDDSYNIFLNGEYMAAFSADSTEWESEKIHNLNEFLRPQVNVLAVEARDEDQSGGGLEASLFVRNIPDWDIKRQKYQIETSDEKVKQNLMMDKYIILF